MSAHIALLRAVNLAGVNKIAMKDLCALFTTLGFADARSLLQSGNVVFKGGRPTTEKLERTLESAATKRFGFEVVFFVRSAAEWADAVADNPFPDEARSDPSHLILLALKDAPARTNVIALQKAIVGREVVKAKGRHAYIVYPDGIGNSKLTSAVIERHLGTRGTGRNWNTVLKLEALAAAP
jgi:uncharacterized protein (DUF1697 family)